MLPRAMGRSVLLACLLGLVTSLTVHGEEPAPLPPEGAWARYFYTVKLSDQRESSATVTLRFLKTERRDEEEFRWVELRQEAQINGVPSAYTIKLLIPESDLRHNANPLAACRQIWTKTDDKAPREFADVYKADLLWGRDFLGMPGSLRGAEPHREERTVDYQRGTLKLETCYRGRHFASYLAKTGDITVAFDTEFTVWPDSAIPGGLAAATMKTLRRSNGNTYATFQTELVLEDYGTDATSDLPDHW